MPDAEVTLTVPSSPFLVRQDMMPPLGVMYLSSALQNNGISARIIDLGLGDNPAPGDLYVTATTPQIDEAIALAHNRSYSVIGGPHASVDPEGLLKYFNTVVVGEAEDIISTIVSNKPVGVVRAHRIREIDKLAFPDRTLGHRYNYAIDGRPATVMITSRGCTGKCTFCCRAVMRGGLFLRSVRNILAEVDDCIAHGYAALQFQDDSITVSRDRIIELAHGLEERGILWRCLSRADHVDAQLLGIMSRCGCREILYGVESGSQTILDNIHKNETVQQQREAILNTKEAGMKAKACFIIGLPGETWDTVEQTIGFILDTKPDAIDVNILCVYMGSEIYSNSAGLVFGPPRWFKGRENEYKSSVRTSKLSEEEIERARALVRATHESLIT